MKFISSLVFLYMKIFGNTWKTLKQFATLNWNNLLHFFKGEGLTIALSFLAYIIFILKFSKKSFLFFIKK